MKRPFWRGDKNQRVFASPIFAITYGDGSSDLTLYESSDYHFSAGEGWVMNRYSITGTYRSVSWILISILGSIFKVGDMDKFYKTGIIGTKDFQFLLNKCDEKTRLNIVNSFIPKSKANKTVTVVATPKETAEEQNISDENIELIEVSP